MFKDASGAVLARAKADGPLGLVAIEHPVVGDCRREEQEASRGSEGMAAWHRCFEAKSRWFATWARRARYAGVRLAGCTIEQAPVSLDVYQDAWWLWWLPLPHVGGAPYTLFSLAVWFDSRACRAAAPPG